MRGPEGLAHLAGTLGKAGVEHAFRGQARGSVCRAARGAGCVFQGELDDGVEQGPDALHLRRLHARDLQGRHEPALPGKGQHEGLLGLDVLGLNA